MSEFYKAEIAALQAQLVEAQERTIQRGNELIEAQKEILSLRKAALEKVGG